MPCGLLVSIEITTKIATGLEVREYRFIYIVTNCSRRPSVLGEFVDGNVALVRIVTY
jgi:hypothetical protein